MSRGIGWIAVAILLQGGAPGGGALLAQVDTEGSAPGVGCTSAETGARDYRLLATLKTSTMERELNEAANEGYRLEDVMGGETAFGGSEVLAVMCKLREAEGPGRWEYRLLATTKTSTMQEELQKAGEVGYEYRGQTVFDTAFSEKEVVVILERDRLMPRIPQYEYRLLATSKTSTMEKELREAGEAGYEFVGVTIGSTFFGGNEVVTILRRRVPDVAL